MAGGCGGLGRGSELPGAAGVALQQVHDGWVALGTYDELLQRQLACRGDMAQRGGHHPIPDTQGHTGPTHNRDPPPSSPRLLGLPPATPADARHLISVHAAPSKTPGFSHETFPLIPSISSHLPSLSVSICRKIFSVLFSGVDSSSGTFITETILSMAWEREAGRGVGACHQPEAGGRGLGVPRTGTSPCPCTQTWG